MSEENNKGEAAFGFDKGAALKAIQVREVHLADGRIAKLPVSILPPGYRELQHEELLDRPLRVVETVTLSDKQSFIDYVGAYKGEASAIFAKTNAVPPTFRAALDYHEKGSVAAHNKHHAKLTLEASDEFKTWTKSNGQPMTQVEFARFLENNLPDICTPSGAELLELVTKFEARTSAVFSSAIRLDNGTTQLEYSEEVRGSSRPGTIEIPREIVLCFPLFRNKVGVATMTARFRYEIKEQKLKLWYELVRPQRVYDDILGSIVKEIKAATRLPIYEGELG